MNAHFSLSIFPPSTHTSGNAAIKSLPNYLIYKKYRRRRKNSTLKCCSNAHSCCARTHSLCSAVNSVHKKTCPQQRNLYLQLSSVCIIFFLQNKHLRMNKMHFVEIEMQLHASPYNFDRGEATTSQSYQTRVGLRLATDGRYLLKTYVPLG